MMIMGKQAALDITDSGTPLAGAYQAISLYSGATKAQKVIMSCWVAGSHIYRRFPAYPHLNFIADGPGTGKSTHLEVCITMCANPVVVDYSSQASIYSWLDEHPDTSLGLDEMDKAFGSTGRKLSRAILHATINASYSSKGKVMVMRNGKSVLMPVYNPVALAGIGRLPDDMRSRCVEVHLFKAHPEQIYVPELDEDGLLLIGKSLGEWLSTAEADEALTAWRDEHQKGLSDLPGDPRWRLILAPLQAIAAYAGIEDQFRQSVHEIVTGITTNPPPSQADLMLADLRELWPEGRRQMTAAAIGDMLRLHPSQRWTALPEGRLGEIALSSLLGEHGISSRVSNGTRGYRRTDITAKVSKAKNTEHSPAEQNTEIETEHSGVVRLSSA